MSPRYLTGIIFLIVLIVPSQARAQQEAVSPALGYTRFQVSTRDADDIRRDRLIRIKADRPDNNVTEMPPKAREQFERNEEEMRKKLDDNGRRWDNEAEWRRKHLRRDHDNDNDRDHRDHDRGDRDRDRWQSTTAMQNGAFVPQTVRSEKTIRHGRHHRRHHRHYRYNYYSRVYVYEPIAVVSYDDDYARSVETVPAGYESIAYGGVTYYYNNGQFYVPTNGDIVEVQPPVGAVVPKLPDDPVVIESNGTYYVYNGIFYRKTWGGYEVIIPPFNPREYDGVYMSANVSPDIYVRLPDPGGNYTEVKLSRTTRGFKGPQGEYYSEFPPIEDLQEMYGADG